MNVNRKVLASAVASMAMVGTSLFATATPANALPQSCIGSVELGQFGGGGWSRCSSGTGSQRIVVTCRNAVTQANVDRRGPWVGVGEFSQVFCAWNEGPVNARIEKQAD
jgi:hypothetical protein